MASEPIRLADATRIGEEFELDQRAYELRRAGRPLKLERIPMELLLLLVSRRGQLVTREEIVAGIWGKDVFLDADNSINAAIRKIRQVLRDDPDRPRFVQTITGKGYRFIAPVVAPAPGLDPAPPEAAQPAAGPAPPAAPDLAGKRVSHYRVLELLGGGGMGLVYKAEDLKLGRSVALKFLPAELATDPAAFGRLQREARAASALDHPNICAIYELGEHEGQPFIVMQLLYGQNLREWIESSPERATSELVKDLVHYGTQICQGLEAAHEKGIVHRDIKPANLFLTTRGEAKILDFGVAKFTHGDAGALAHSSAGAEAHTGTDAQFDSAAAGQNGAPHEHHTAAASDTRTAASSDTRTAAALGTPSYLSPEQVLGEKLDGRTDLFSFGLVLYEMATGIRAFSADTTAEIRHAVLHLPEAPVRELRPDLPVELEHIIHKALEKDRERRYQTAAEIRNDLEKLRLPASSPAVPVAVAAPAATRARWKMAAVAALAIAVLAGGLLYYRSWSARRLTDQDTIVIGDFSNSTGDAIFDDTLKQGLSVALRQSPFLNLLSDGKAQDTLKLMTRPPGARLDPDTAREVCQRTGSKVSIEGAIAPLGSDYVIGLKALNCNTGDVMARQQVTATSKEKVIASLGEAASALRAELGESLATVQKFDQPLQQVTTSSLDALKAYSLAVVESRKGSYLTAIPLLKQAIEQDSDFAIAYASLGQNYANSGQNDLAVENIKQAYARRGRASEREKLYITTRYSELVTGDADQRVEALQSWKQLYPHDPAPVNDLASEYTDMGRFADGIPEAQATIRLEPTGHTGFELLGIAYMGLNRFAEARATREKEVDLKIDYHWDHVDLFAMAALENDAAGMQRQLDWAKGNKYEFYMLQAAASDQAARGRMQAARETWRHAMESAGAAGFANSAHNMALDLALTESMLGGPLKIPAEATQPATGNHTLLAAGRLYALNGDEKRATALADSMLKQSPSATYVSRVWAPAIQAEVEIHRGNAARAIELLQPAGPYEYGSKAENLPAYVRGRAYLRAGRGSEAAAEFQKVLDHQGTCLFGPLANVICAVSRLELARARALAGDSAAARTAYQDFLARWKDADADVPLLAQARQELARLK